jgi:hypothetical protein
MTYPTISISVWADRLPKLNELLALYRKDDPTISRTEIFWYAIDALHTIKCPSESSDANTEGQRDAA